MCPTLSTCAEEFSGDNPLCLFVLLVWWVIPKFLCFFPWTPFVKETLSTYFGRWLQHHAAKGLGTSTRDPSEQPCEVLSFGARLFGWQTELLLDLFCSTVSRPLDTLNYISELKWSKKGGDNKHARSKLYSLFTSYLLWNRFFNKQSLILWLIFLNRHYLPHLL